jgi:hypothetical protein
VLSDDEKNFVSDALGFVRSLSEEEFEQVL